MYKEWAAIPVEEDPIVAVENRRADRSTYAPAEMHYIRLFIIWLIWQLQVIRWSIQRTRTSNCFDRIVDLGDAHEEGDENVAAAGEQARHERGPGLK